MGRSGDYELVDIGDGRRLERFGSRLLDRPSPTAIGLPRRDPDAWSSADARFERTGDGTGRWLAAGGIEPWTVAVGGLTFELRLNPSGQVGCFPEQAASWGWISEHVSAMQSGRPVDILNLFGHTGGATLAAARSGARVVHVDAARPAIVWARRNAALNGLSSAPIRWIVDDARAFVLREVRRGRAYAGIVLDPPSYGHGPRRRSWRLEADLPALLRGCAALLASGPAFLVLSVHTPGFEPDRLADELRATLGAPAGGMVTAESLALEARSGSWLGLGAIARWSR